MRSVGALAGQLAAVEEMFALKALMAELGVKNIDCALSRLAAATPSTAAPAICSTRPFAGIDEADAIMLIGTNPRKESPVLNARIRKRYLQAAMCSSA